MGSKFVKRVEDFICDKCSREVKGNGFTNHCPYCLWSKHVDVNPGDRAATCQGLMEPLNVIHETGNYVVTQRCLTCRYEKRNKLSSQDDFDVAMSIVKKMAE